MRLARGDDAAMEALVSAFGAPIRTLLARYLGDWSEAEDLTQDVFLTLWQKAGRFDAGRGSGVTWIYTIARNKARDALRRRRIRHLIGLEDLPGEPADDRPGTEAALSDRQRLARVQAGLAGLPDKQRMALLLSVVAGLDNPAIAQTMATTRGAVEQLLVRARRSLRLGLGETET